MFSVFFFCLVSPLPSSSFQFPSGLGVVLQTELGRGVGALPLAPSGPHNPSSPPSPGPSFLGAGPRSGTPPAVPTSGSAKRARRLDCSAPPQPLRPRPAPPPPPPSPRVGGAGSGSPGAPARSPEPTPPATRATLGTADAAPASCAPRESGAGSPRTPRAPRALGTQLRKLWNPGPMLGGGGPGRDAQLSTPS